MNPSATSSYLKNDIADSLILLLRSKELHEISVSEITEKAGVNRSTYYRHYRTKEEVVRHYYACRLDEYLSTVSPGISLQDYLTGMFTTFVQYKKEMILLNTRSLSYLILEEMNSRIPDSLYATYHIGGVFNCFLTWLHEEMATPPAKLAEQCVSFLPRDFIPRLLR